MNKFYLNRYNSFKLLTAATGLLAIFLVAGCQPASIDNSGADNASQTNSAPRESILFLSVTSDAKQSPQSVDMAMKLAGFSLDEGRKVVMFFQVKGVTCPTKDFPDDFAFQEE